MSDRKRFYDFTGKNKKPPIGTFTDFWRPLCPTDTFEWNPSIKIPADDIVDQFRIIFQNEKKINNFLVKDGFFRWSDENLPAGVADDLSNAGKFCEYLSVFVAYRPGGINRFRSLNRQLEIRDSRRREEIGSLSRTGVCLPSDLTIRLNIYSVYMHKTWLPTASEAFMRTGVFRAETEKPIAVFISDLARLMALNGFIIHNEEQMEMVHHFGHHGVELAGGVNLHMLQVCAPKRAAQSLQENIERAVLLPRHIIVFSRDGRTQVRMLCISGELAAELVDDGAFPELYENVSASLVSAIRDAL